MSEFIDLGIKAIKRLSPHPSRFAKYIPKRNQYIQIPRSLTDEDIESHIRGVKLLGGVSSDQDGMTTSVGLDLDAHTADQKPFLAARRFTKACQALDIPVVVHTSKSGKGLHIRTLFRKPVAAWMARALFLALSIAAQIDGDRALDKIWPPSRGYGVLALPYQSTCAKYAGGTMALDPNSLEPVDKGCQLEVVTEAEELDPDDIPGILAFMGIRTEQQAKILANGSSRLPRGVMVKHGTDRGIQEMVLRCAAVRRLQSEADSIPYEFWFGMMTNFKPFWGGKSLFEEFSKLDEARFDARAMSQSWNAITGRPRLCENLQRGWVCPDRAKCPARAPAGLPFAVRRQSSAAQSNRKVVR